MPKDGQKTIISAHLGLSFLDLIVLIKLGEDKRRRNVNKKKSFGKSFPRRRCRNFKKLPVRIFPFNFNSDNKLTRLSLPQEYPTNPTRKKAENGKKTSYL